MGGYESNSTSREWKCELYTFSVYTVFIGFMCIVGFIGNIVSFIVFYNDKLKTSFLFLLQALAIVDTLMITCVFSIYSIQGFVQFTGLFRDSYNRYMYPVFMIIIYPFAFAFQALTVWLTVLLAVNRYIAVCMPYQALKICTVKRARIYFAIVLLLALIYTLPKFVEGNLELLPQRFCLTRTRISDNFYYELVYHNIMYTALIFILPLSVLTFLNIRLMVAFKDVKRKRKKMQSLKQRNDDSITLVLIVVVIVFTVCQLPAFVTQILWTVVDDDVRTCGGFQFYFSPVSNALVMCNSSVNFFIYVFLNRRFRKILYQTACIYLCCCKREKVEMIHRARKASVQNRVFLFRFFGN
ncbi:hypothetical protein HELRODRAFT_116471 [Helobdella robusta]|uniref:G-protein coupled receptors family 1 profile domain-containing protein n=1 Tax=Helobdella robusta TaxID=6412 RepID=T1EGF2_HELRO|nr:hypothetical protein HELRODRAFT_116471 [Helobdella robusta]ESN90914.1 hypothetical protein HELRODRAFT_116471 [Helobdella robusta]